MSTDISTLLGDVGSLVDTSLLELTEETRDKFNRGRLVQGNPEFEKDATLNKTPRYLGGIALSVDGLPEEILAKSTIVTLESGDWAAFTELDVVVLASARIRRYFGEVDGQSKVLCGTNRDGQGSKGWSGKACITCPYHVKNFDGEKRDACKGSIVVLGYVPSLDHTAVFEFHGGSYMDTSEWLTQVAELSKKFAQKPEMQSVHPGLARVNSHFFKTTLSAGAFKANDKGDKFQPLSFSKASAPYDWAAVLNDGATIKKCTEIVKSLEEVWKAQYVEHNPSAVMSLPTADSAPKQLSGDVAPADTGKIEADPSEAPAVSTIKMDIEEPESVTVEVETVGADNALQVEMF